MNEINTRDQGKKIRILNILSNCIILILFVGSVGILRYALPGQDTLRGALLDRNYDADIAFMFNSAFSFGFGFGPIVYNHSSQHRS